MVSIMVDKQTREEDDIGVDFVHSTTMKNDMWTPTWNGQITLKKPARVSKDTFRKLDIEFTLNLSDIPSIWKLHLMRNIFVC